MKTYDELYDYIKSALDDGSELEYADGWYGGVYGAYKYVLNRLEEIREAEEKHPKSEMRVDALLGEIENLERALSEMQSQSSELYLALCEAELKSKKEVD